MQIRTREVELRVDGRPMRTVVVAPSLKGRYPGLLFYSEIFQLTGPIRRSMERLAGDGFVVAGARGDHRTQPPGGTLPGHPPRAQRRARPPARAIPPGVGRARSAPLRCSSAPP